MVQCPFKQTFERSVVQGGSVIQSIRGSWKMVRAVMGAMIAVLSVWVAVVGVPLGIWLYLSWLSLTTKKGDER